MIKFNHQWINTALLVVVVILALVGGTNQRLGGTTNYDQLDVSDGYAVDGVTIIDGSGNLDGVVTSSTGSFSGLLTLNGGQLRSYTNSTSTTATTYTLVQADLLNYDTMLVVLNTGNTTFTLPATSTMTTMVPTAGDTQKICIYNATSTAGITLTLAAGTGVDLQSATSSLAINKGTTGCLSFIRQTDTDVTALFDRYLDAD